MIHSFVNSFLKEEDGQDLVEYSLLLAFIALAATAFLTKVQTDIGSIWKNVQKQLNTAAKSKG
jgi:Flp pilus assembly pilin Flp